jgi:predicted transcriptional regulator
MLVCDGLLFSIVLQYHIIPFRSLKFYRYSDVGSFLISPIIRLDEILIRTAIRLFCHHMKYRSRTDITAQILEAANGGSTKARIMYRTFLSYVQLRGYLIMLVENGLLEFDGTTQTYTTTDKGHRFVQTYNQIGEFLAPRQQRRGQQYQRTLRSK